MRKVKRTPEDIRDALRAELPAVRALERRMVRLYREIKALPEYRRHVALIEYDDHEKPPAEYFELQAVGLLDAPFCDPDHSGINSLRELATCIEKVTGLKRWKAEPRRARAWHRKHLRSEREGRAEWAKKRAAAEARARELVERERAFAETVGRIADGLEAPTVEQTAVKAAAKVLRALPSLVAAADSVTTRPLSA